MRHDHLLFLAALLALKPADVAAQTQKVIPPKTVYWMSAATQSGFGMPGAAPSTADMMRMAMGGGGPGTMKLLSLDLGSKLTPTGAPAASHAIPPGMDMGAMLPLKSPTPSTYREGDDEFERPKGKLLLFWGCGEAARPGQPVVIDFARAAAGELPPGLFGGERVRIQRPPSPSTWPSYGHWPNDDRKAPQVVPAKASLLGAHKVSGNYTPNIDFSLSQDWMGGIRMNQQKLPSGAMQLGWNVVPGATSHFAQMVAGTEKRGEGTTVVYWSSSDVQTFLSGMTDFVSPSEAQRLVAKKQMMPPAQTSCAIPKEALAAAGNNGIIMLVSHGPEVNIVHPPRPTDPKVPWVQEWAMKARYASRTGGVLGMNMDEMGEAGSDDADADKAKCKPATPSVGGMAGAIAGGLFGKKKKADCKE